MNEKNVKIRGIERNATIPGVADGGLIYAEGIRSYLDVKLPASNLQQLITYNTGKLIYVHTFQNNSINILYDDANHTLLNGDNRELIVTADVVEVNSNGAILIVLCKDKIRYFIHKEGSYHSFMPDNLPRIVPVVYDKKTSKSETSTINAVTGNNPDGINAEDFLGEPTITFKDETLNIRITDAFAASIGQLKDETNDQSRIIGSIILRYGLRLYDGSYINYSPPILIEQDNSISYYTNFPVRYWESGAQNRTIREFNVSVEAASYRIKLRIPATQADDGTATFPDFINLNEDINPYIDIFASIPDIGRAYDDKKIETIKNAVWSPTGLSSVRPDTVIYDVSGQWDVDFTERDFDFEAIANYYRIFSIPVNELKNALLNTDGTYYEIEMDLSEKLPNIEQQPVAPADTRPHSYFSDNSMVLNGRLHIFNLYEKLFSGYRFQDFSYIDNVAVGSANTITSYTFISSDGGNYVVKNVNDRATYDRLSKIISYPDARAYKIVVLRRVNLGSADAPEYAHFLREYPLQQHDMQDLAYYYDFLGTAIDNEYRISETMYNDTIAQYDAMINDTLYRPQVMKVSNLNNPMVFPNATTYNIGDGEIRGLAVAHHAISTGQFGQYPLYLFSDKGMYVMESGLPDIVYKTTTPINTHVLLSKKVLCSLENAIVFGTEQGLFIMQGGEFINISEPLNEHSQTRLRHIEQDALHYFGLDNINVRTIQDILPHAHLAYNYKLQELYMFIPDQDMVYTYNLQTRTWGINRWNISYIVENYPDLLLVKHDTNNIVQQVPVRTTADNVCERMILITQPMSFDALMAYKRVLRLTTLSLIKGKDSDTPAQLNVLIFGSNDGESFALIWQRTMSIVAMHDITAPHIGGAYRYYVVAIKGENLSHDSYIGNMLVDYAIQRYTR